MLTLEKFEEASEVVKKVAIETKLLYSPYFSERIGNKVYLKPENMQVTGAYKIRGAYYKISTLSERGACQGTDYRVRRKSRPGRGLCGKGLRRESSDRYANHHTADEGGAHQELWRGGCAVRRRI